MKIRGIQNTQHVELSTPCPKVTVSIPTFNRSKFLCRAVQSALHQSYLNIEVVVSDNASTDDTLMHLQEINDTRLLILRQSRNLGMMENWNACLKASHGKYFMLLSDDDFLEEDAIEKMLSVFESQERLEIGQSLTTGIVYCGTKIVNEYEEIVEYTKEAPSRQDSFEAISSFFSANMGTYPCSILFRTSDLKEVGGYDAIKYPLAADAAAWMQIVLKYGQIIHINEFLSNYRVHSSNVTKQATIIQWMVNNQALADMCSNAFERKGETERARLVQELVGDFNAKTASHLIVQSSRGDNSKIDAIIQIFVIRRYFMGFKRKAIFFLGILKVLVPHYQLETRRKTKGKT